MKKVYYKNTEKWLGSGGENRIWWSCSSNPINDMHEIVGQEKREFEFDPDLDHRFKEFHSQMYVEKTGENDWEIPKKHADHNDLHAPEYCHYKTEVLSPSRGIAGIMSSVYACKYLKAKQ